MKAIAIVVSVTLAMSGCDRKPVAPSGSSGGPPPATASAPTDWSSVAPATSLEAMDALCRLSRLADFVVKGGAKSVRIRFVEGKATAPDGTSCSVTPQEWKGIVEGLPKDGGRGAARALPADDHNYKDGRGRVLSHAFLVARESDDVLVFDVAKALTRDSDG